MSSIATVRFFYSKIWGNSGRLLEFLQEAPKVHSTLPRSQSFQKVAASIYASLGCFECLFVRYVRLWFTALFFFSVFILYWSIWKLVWVLDTWTSIKRERGCLCTLCGHWLDAHMKRASFQQAAHSCQDFHAEDDKEFLDLDVKQNSKLNSIRCALPIYLW